jgi:signal transduction histidine kinase
VLGDSLLLRRILENLVGNALDSIAGRPGATVTVSTEPAANGSNPTSVRIVVADTGPGMTQTELDRAFDDFYTTKAGGTGLGLSIVRRLILDLNGSLRVETAPGVGTRVVVELPGTPTGGAAA